MAGRTVLVTGGTGGIGKATATGLAAMGARVAITGRDRGRADAAAAEIRADGGPPVEVFVGDMSAQAEVRRLAAEVLAALPRLDVLVNNVGGFWNSRHVTADGLERTFALNHLAPFLLTHLLVDRLVEDAPRPHRHGLLRRAAAWGASTSTICRASDRGRASARTTSPSSPTSCSPTSWPEGSGARTSPRRSCTPGIVRTGFGAEDPGRIQRVITPFMGLMKSPEQGARTPIHLASSPEVEGVTGQFFAKRKPRKSAKRSYDTADAVRLWEISAELVGLDDTGRLGSAHRDALMRVGVHLVNFTLPGGPASIGPTLAAVGPAAEEAGVANLSLMDHYLQLDMLGGAAQPMLEGYTGLGFLAGAHHDRRAAAAGAPGSRTGTRACWRRSSRPLDVLSGGRAALGIGAAWYEREHRALGVPYPPVAERFERLEETLQIVRQMWSEDDGPFEGRHYRLAETINVPQPLRAARRS